jgi:DNA-binding SARP family transcriptional activator
MPVITCRVLGPPELLVDGAPPPVELMWRKNLAMLVYLARSPRRTRSRDHLMGLFWADRPEASARHSLREAVRVVRKAISEDGLLTEHDQVRLADDAVRLDVEDLLALEATEDWCAAAALVVGEFLEGFGVPDSSGFEDWLIGERETWRRHGVHALVCHADDRLRAGRGPEATAAAHRALALDAGSDQAARAAMQALALAGDRSGALACYEQLAARLHELGAAPAAETRALFGRIQQEREWRLSDEVPVDPERGAESRRSPLVGRERELRQLLDVYGGAAADRRAGAAVILAAQGLGKSRLAEELLARARLLGATVAAVRAVEGDLAVPWSGLLGLARGGLRDAKGIAGASGPALAAFAREIPEWADRFGKIAGEPAALPVAFGELLRALTVEQPVVLLADDAHWLDAESMLALIQATRDLRDAPFLLVLSAHEEPARAELDDLRSRLGRDLRGVAIHLHPLDEPAIRELAHWAVPSYTAEEVDRLARRIASDSAGLPLLAIELLHAVALGMDFGVISGAWPEPLKTLDQTLPADLPDAIVAAIRVGFRRLSQDAQILLTAVAVIGGRVSAATLARVTGMVGAPLEAALDELEWQRWLSAEPRGYTFIARIMREVVNRDMVLEGQRQRILAAV